MWNTSVPQGKILYVPRWTLGAQLVPVITVGQDIVPGNRLSEFGNELADFSSLQVQLTYDGQDIFSGSFQGFQPIAISHDVVDDQVVTEHIFEIALSGKTDDHSCFYQGQSVSLGIKIDLTIETLPVELLCMVSGLPKIMGENRRYQMTIQTPIYQWLFKNQEYIMNNLRSLYTP